MCRERSVDPQRDCARIRSLQDLVARSGMAKSDKAEFPRRMTAAWRTRIMTATTGGLIVGRAAAVANVQATAASGPPRRRRLQSAYLRSAMGPLSESHICQWNPYGLTALVPVIGDDAADADPTMFGL